jgi:hypothetical protein
VLKLKITTTNFVKVTPLDLMTHASPRQLHILFGLDDQRIIVNQLYNLALQTTRTQIELNQSW